jgi:hypothetical protein
MKLPLRIISIFQKLSFYIQGVSRVQWSKEKDEYRHNVVSKFVA